MPEKKLTPEKHEGHDHKPHRAKDGNETHKESVHGLSDDLNSFYNELSKKYPNIRVTSGRRKSNGGAFSHHHHGDALDIGKEHTDVFDYLYNDAEGLALMNKYGLGVYDETDPVKLAKTGGTGPHFHIGKDGGLYSTTQSRLNNYANTQPVHSFISQNPAYNYSSKPGQQMVNTNLKYSMTNRNVIQAAGEGFQVIVPQDQAGMLFMAEVDKQKTKAEIKEEKDEASAARKRLAAIQKEREAKQAEFRKILRSASEADDELYKSREERSESSSEPVVNPAKGIDIQDSLPNMQNIFTYQ